MGERGPNESMRYDDEVEVGGDPVCWLHLTCPRCGAFVDDPGHGARCAAVGGLDVGRPDAGGFVD
ncbi:MAG: hypothetical protein ACP5OV_02655 [Acidimicrobiales bacterium]